MRQTDRMDIREFIAARLDEDEAAARAAADLGVGIFPDWIYDPGSGVVANPHRLGVVMDTGTVRGTHIARHDPARVLAEVAAKRAIVAEHANGGELVPGKYFCTECGSGEPYEYPTQWPCATLRLLATVHADHPDFDPAWKPNED